MKTSYASELPFEIGQLGMRSPPPSRIDRWLVKRGDVVTPDMPVAHVTIGRDTYQLSLLFPGKVDLIQTEVGEALHPGIALLQVVHEAPRPKAWHRWTHLSSPKS